MKTFAARPQATAAVALVLAAATVPAIVGGDTSILAMTLILCMLAAAIAVHDLAALLIPDRYTLGIFLVAIADWWFQIGDPRALLWRIALGVALALALWLFDFGYGALRGRTGIGMGDIKLIGASAILVDIGGVGVQIVLASVAALIFIAMRAIRLRRPLRAASKVPFGTFLAPALVIVWAWLPAPW